MSRPGEGPVLRLGARVYCIVRPARRRPHQSFRLGISQGAAQDGDTTSSDQIPGFPCLPRTASFCHSSCPTLGHPVTKTPCILRVALPPSSPQKSFTLHVWGADPRSPRLQPLALQKPWTSTLRPNLVPNSRYAPSTRLLRAGANRRLQDGFKTVNAWVC